MPQDGNRYKLSTYLDEQAPGGIRLTAVRKRDVSILESGEHGDPIDVMNELAEIFKKEFGNYSGGIFDNLEWFNDSGEVVDEPKPDGKAYNFGVVVHTPSDDKNWSIDGAVRFKRGVWVGGAEVEEEIIQ